MKRTILLGFTLFFSIATTSGAFAFTKGIADKKATCQAKVAAKNVPKAQRTAEYEKCLGDPVNYQ